jgi:cardiolipin synthase
MDLKQWETDLGEITGTRLSSGSLQYLVNGEEYFSALKDAVTSAEKSVYIRSYIFDNDDFAMEIADLLKQRSESVDIRVLLDGLGTILATRTSAPTLPIDYKAPGSVRSYLTKDTRLRVRQQTNPWMTGDHSKTTIVDGRLAFVGGMNIGREYRYEWHDLMMKVKGPVVDELRHDFMGTWRHAGALGDLGKLLYSLKPKKRMAGDLNGEAYPVRVLRTRPGDPDIFRAQLAAIKRAKKRIFIESPYLSDDTILHELIRARHRGVDVRVVLPGENENRLMQTNNLAVARTLMKHGARVYHYPGMTHVKAAVYDGWACLGSANMDKLSFRVNREINLATSNPSAVERLVKRLFLPDFAKSVELSEPPPRKWNTFFAEAVADHL